jgi:hypothetical protein
MASPVQIQGALLVKEFPLALGKRPTLIWPHCGLCPPGGGIGVADIYDAPAIVSDLMTTEYNAGSRVAISSHTAAFWEKIYAIDLRFSLSMPNASGGGRR